MKNFFTTKRLCRAGVIAGLYVALTYAFGAISYQGILQIRPAEALTILPLFFPEAVPALWIGCMLANLGSPFIAFDVPLGGFAAGVFAMGGCAVGAFACGGFAYGSIVAIGDVAVGGIALGDTRADGSVLSVLQSEYLLMKSVVSEKLDGIPKIWSGFTAVMRNMAEIFMKS